MCFYLKLQSPVLLKETQSVKDCSFFDLHCLWFTPVLPPDVCLLLLYLHTPVLHREPWTVYLWWKSYSIVFDCFNLAENPIQWDPMFFLSDQRNPSSSSSHVSCWQRALLLNLILFMLSFLCLSELSPLIKNLRAVARCYVKHWEPEPPSLLPFSWPFSVLSEH